MLNEQFTPEQLNIILRWLDDASESGLTLDDLISTLRDPTEDFAVQD